VYRVWHTGLHRHEALKLLPPDRAVDRRFAERFLAEARLAARLRHPNIATIYSVSDADTQPSYFSMELVEGEDLARVMAKGPLPVVDAVPILRQMAAALDYAHASGVIHRDVKPANVLLRPELDRAVTAKLVDFGIARAAEADDQRLTSAGTILGTPEYMSPEQAEGLPVDYRSDIYSLGVVAYEMLCGKPPFKSSARSAIQVLMAQIREQPRPPSEIAPGVPEEVSRAMLRALAKQPGERYASCSDFVNALDAASRPIAVRPDAATADAGVRRRTMDPLLLLAAALALCGCALIGGRIVWLLGRPPLQSAERVVAERQAVRAESLVTSAEQRMVALGARVAKHKVAPGELRTQIEAIRPEFQEAERLSIEAIGSDGGNRRAWMQLARSLHYLGDERRAHDVIVRALSLFPSDSNMNLLKTIIEGTSGVSPLGSSTARP